MSNFPTAVDDDGSIYRIDENISELGSDVINQLRSAVFAIESNLGLTLAGSKSSGSARLDVSLNPDGTIKASALTSIGLVTLPITNAQVGVTAGILESKLALNYSTSSLHTLIQANSVLLNSLSAFEAALEVKLNSHIAGGPASNLRHVASHIDINAHPIDSRDSGYSWTGLINKDGYQLSATNVADALKQINNTLTGHQNQTIDSHNASSISVDTSNFEELLQSSQNVQDVLDNIDNIEVLQLGSHRATQHSNGIPKDARAINLNSVVSISADGYNIQVVSYTPVLAHVAHNPPGTAPVDNVTNGDSIISFLPTSNTGAIFDAQFSQVKIGDIIRINYGTKEDLRRVESIRFTPGSEWIVRINGVNLKDTDGYMAFARIDRPLYDPNTYGVLAVAAANAIPLSTYSNILGSVIVGNPRGASALGVGFNPNQIDGYHYNLYLELYPTGNPTDHVISMPAVDVSGNQGTTPGLYTIDYIVKKTNDKFRDRGYNYRFISFSVDNNFGIMLADDIDGASFAIISGSNSTGSLTEGIYTKNVVGNVYSDNFDGLGLGLNKADLASPAYQSIWLDSTAAQIPTKIIHPVKLRNYIVNGRPFDQFKNKDLTTTTGYWVGSISARTVTGSSVEVTYRVNDVLNTAGLKPGKTVLIQPAVAYTDGYYSDVDYGRFIIKEVIFNPCNCVDNYTLITVINGRHATGSSLGSSGAVGLPIRLFFSEDSVGFDDQNIIDSSDNSLNYHRHHEIFITDQKTTLSHERGRMLYQNETTSLLNSTNLHINLISPKLSGYRDTGLTTLNKFIRFYVLNYNAVSGEYDGYIGKRNPSNTTISHCGPIIRGRKNVSTRFYDETNVDYIDLEFNDNANSYPGNVIAPGPRYVDIELFPSLKLNDELLFLATCEINWTPASGTNIIDRVVDRRPRGGTSELEFTQSAVDFISAGNRYLNQNGIVRGFEFTAANINNSRDLLFNGGIALVNGKIVIVNNTSVTIPQITNNSIPPQTLDWAICVNENGNLISIPLTATKVQFFARDYSTGNIYYIPSVSFIELVNSRKDLTIISIVNVTIASFTVNTISDARKLIKNESASIPLVWYGKDGYDTDTNSGVSDLVGHFNSFEQVKNWINWTKSTKNVIKVKGVLTFNSMLDLSQLKYPTTIDGQDGATFVLNGPLGITLGSDISIKNVNLNWSPGSLFYGTSNVNTIDLSANYIACLYAIANDSSQLKNIKIDNCTFTGTFPQSQRPPYISFVLDGNSAIYDNVKITNNKFSDPSNVTYQNAISFVATTTDSDTSSPVIANCLIENNIANNNQSIIMSAYQTLSTTKKGLLVINSFIKNNNVGSIGYLIGSNNGFVPANADNNSPNYELNILNNTAVYIGTLNRNGLALDPAIYSNPLIGSGNVKILNNTCSIIYCNIYPSSTDYKLHSESLLISQNTLTSCHNFAEIYTAYGFLALILIHSSGSGVLVYNTGIVVNGYFNYGGSNSIDEDTRVVQILDNNITYYTDATNVKQSYDDGIFVDSCPAIIRGNILKNFGHRGISCINNVNHVNTVKVDISNNQFYNSSTVTTTLNYISVDDNINTKVKFSIKDNFFDTYTVNGSPSNMLTTGSVGHANLNIKNNINHTDTIKLRAVDIGKVVINSSISNVNRDPVTDALNSGNGNVNYIYYGRNDTFNADADPSLRYAQLSLSVKPNGNLSWVVPIANLFRDANFVSASINYEMSGVTIGDSKILSMKLYHKQSGGDVAILNTSVISTSSLSSGTLTITNSLSNPTELWSGDYIIINFSEDVSASSNAVVHLQPLMLTYRY